VSDYVLQILGSSLQAANDMPVIRQAAVMFTGHVTQTL
jgi:hypothetical protein